MFRIMPSGGVPAKLIKYRFSENEIEQHEMLLAKDRRFVKVGAQCNSLFECVVLHIHIYIGGNKNVCI